MSNGNNNVPNSAEAKVVNKEVINTANDLLDSLEQSHRADLALHLYSSYLLKTHLYRANDKKSSFEIGQFIKTQIKDNWTSWPDPRTVIDPQTDKLYEDTISIGKQDGIIKPGEISPKALTHAANMLNIELNSFWQHCLARSSAISESVLDVDKMVMPEDLTHNVLDKLDHFFSGLHNKVAAKNKIEIQQDQLSHQLTVSQPSLDKVKANKRVELTFHDIIARGSEMGEDMEEIYMKSLELFHDIPSTLEKGQFKLPKSLLKEYRPARQGRSGIKALSNSREDFLELAKLLKDKRLSAKDKSLLHKVTKRTVEQNLNKKTFLHVQAYKSYGQDDDESSANSDEIYNMTDCLINIPWRNR